MKRKNNRWISSSVKKKKFNRTVLQWFWYYGRNLPWRNTRNPYKILVSEMMLQQTQVLRVLPKYREFLGKFSTVKHLAAAPLGDVLRVWSGLGYNRRAKYVWQCAQIIVGRCGGRFPHEFEELKLLPGVGRSTAAAVSTFAFGKDEPMLDTNVRRVLTRVFFQSKLPTDAGLYTFAKALIPPGKGREWNLAVMDIGALFCRAGRHDNACPLTLLHGQVKPFPYKNPQPRFTGSPRYWRGKILAVLACRPEGYTSGAISETLGLSRRESASYIQVLRKEGLLREHKDLLRLP